jgi:transposase InsO family protein
VGLAAHRHRRGQVLHLGRDPRHPHNPAARHASPLTAARSQLQAVSTNNGSAFRSHDLRRAPEATGAQQQLIRAGRPQTNGCVEQVQRTILDECWRLNFARPLVPKVTALQRDLAQYLDYYNLKRAHTRMRNRGLTPAALAYGARKMRPKRAASVVSSRELYHLDGEEVGPLLLDHEQPAYTPAARPIVHARDDGVKQSLPLDRFSPRLHNPPLEFGPPPVPDRT